jgi:hypothetical protein
MNSEKHFSDLQKQFGPVSVLYSEQLAIVFGKKSSAAVLGLISRGGFPVPVLEVGGRPAVAVRAVADWLASLGESKPETLTPAGAPPVAAPKRKQAAFGGALNALRFQINFLSDLAAEMENLELRGLIEDPNTGPEETL